MLLLALSLIAASPEPAQPLTVTLAPFASEGVPEAELAYWSAYFANQLRVQGIRVAATPEPDAAISGTLTRTGDAGLRISLKASAAGEGVTLAAVSMTAQTRGEIVDVLQRSAQEFAAVLFPKLNRVPVPQKAEALPEAPAVRTTTRLPPGLAMGVAVVVLGAGGAIAGGVLLVMSKNQLAAVARGVPTSYFSAQQEASNAKSLSTASAVLLGVGGAMLAGGLLYSLYSARVDTFLTVSGLVLPGQGGLVFSGAWP